MYYEDLEKRGGCGVVARERHERHMPQKGEPLAKEKQLKISPLFKILAVKTNLVAFKIYDLTSGARCAV